MKSKLLIVLAVLGVAVVLAVLANRPSSPVPDLIGEPREHRYRATRRR